MTVWTYPDFISMLEDYPDLFYPEGFESCIMGVVIQSDGTAAILMDEDKIIDMLAEKDDMTRPEAWEFYEDKILGARMKNGPAYLVDSVKGFEDD